MSIRILLTAALALAMTGCLRFGQVNQGRVITYDQASGVITLVSDSNYKDPHNPRYDVLPPVAIRIPADPKEMGPAPKPGKLLQLDLAAGRMVVFDAATNGFKSIPFQVAGRRDDAPAEELKKPPVVDRATGTVTLTVSKSIVTLAVPAEYLSLPDDTWKAGDEIRYYYKEPGQALRLMNVTQTDVSTGKS